jgi:hypothetical protein
MFLTPSLDVKDAYLPLPVDRTIHIHGTSDRQRQRQQGLWCFCCRLRCFRFLWQRSETNYSETTCIMLPLATATKLRDAS